MNCYLSKMDAQRSGCIRHGVFGRCHVGVCTGHAALYPEHGFTCVECARELGLAQPAAVKRAGFLGEDQYTQERRE